MSSRAQSEVLGVTLLVGVVVIAASAFGAAYVTQSTAATDGPTVTVTGAVTVDAVSVAHRGGDAVGLADVRVLLRNATETSYAPTASDVVGSDGDDRFDPGERLNLSRAGPAGEPVDLLVVHDPSSSVLYRESLRVTVPGTSGPPPVATAAPRATPTAAPTVTPTPTPTATSTPAPPTATPTPSDETSPTIRVGAPDGGELLRGGETSRVEWTASDGRSSVDDVTLQYVVGGGRPTTIATVPNAGEYDWTVPDVDSGDVRVVVVAEDGAGNVASDRSDAPFTIDSTPPSATTFDATSSGRTVTVAAEFDERVVDLTVPLSDSGGGAVTVLTTADFTESTTADGYRYEATYTVSADGTYTATLETAVDAAGNDGASGQQATTTAERVVAYADADRDRTLDASETVYSEADLQSFDEPVNLVVKEAVRRPKFQVKADSILLRQNLTTGGSNSAKLTATGGTVEVATGATVRAPAVTLLGESIAVDGGVDATAGAATLKAEQNGGGTVTFSSIAGDSVTITGRAIEGSGSDVVARSGSVSASATKSGGGSVNLDGATVVGTGVTFSGTEVVAGGATVDASTGSASLKATASGAETVDVSGATIDAGSLTAEGNSIAASNAALTVGGSAGLTATKDGSGAVDVSGATVDVGSLTAEGESIVASNAALTVGGSASLTATENAGGTADLSGATVDAGSLSVEGQTIAGPGATLDVAGSASLTATTSGVGAVDLSNADVDAGSLTAEGKPVDASDAAVVVAGSATLTATGSGGGEVDLSDGTIDVGSLAVDARAIVAPNAGVEANGSASLTSNAGDVRLDRTQLDGGGELKADVGGGTLFVDAAEVRTDGAAGVLNNGNRAPVTGCPAVGEVRPRSDGECSQANRTDEVSGSGSAGSGSGNSGNNGRFSFQVENAGTEPSTVVAVAVNATSANSNEVGNGDILTADGTSVVSRPIPVGGGPVDFDGDVTLGVGQRVTFRFDKFLAAGSPGNGNNPANMNGASVTLTLYFDDGSKRTYTFTDS